MVSGVGVAGPTQPSAVSPHGGSVVARSDIPLRWALSASSERLAATIGEGISSPWQGNRRLGPELGAFVFQPVVPAIHGPYPLNRSQRWQPGVVLPGRLLM